MHLAHFARLAFDFVTQHIGSQTRRTRHLRRRFERLLRSGHQVHRLFMPSDAELGGFQRARQQGRLHLRRHRNAVALQNSQRIGAGGVVAHRGATGNDRGVVARHVADGERHHLGRRTRSGQAPTLDAREVLAHTVHLGDVGAAVQQVAVDALLVLQAHPLRRQGQQRGAAARDQAQHQVVFRQPLGQGQDALRGGQACGIGHRVRSLHHLDACRQTRWARRRVVVARDHQARERLVCGPQGLHRLGHGPTGFACAQHQGAAFGRWGQPCGGVVQGQGALHGGVKELTQESWGVADRCTSEIHGGDCAVGTAPCFHLAAHTMRLKFAHDHPVDSPCPLHRCV